MNEAIEALRDLLYYRDTLIKVEAGDTIMSRYTEDILRKEAMEAWREAERVVKVWDDTRDS